MERINTYGYKHNLWMRNLSTVFYCMNEERTFSTSGHSLISFAHKGEGCQVKIDVNMGKGVLDPENIHIRYGQKIWVNT